MPRDTPEQAAERDARYRTTSGKHVARYLATGGADGFDNNAHQAPTLLLTTTGRRTGKKIVTPLYYGVDAENERYIIIASYAGSDSHPKWYLNLNADPQVRVQIKGDAFSAIAHTATTKEKDALWPILADAYPFYNNYRDETNRDIPLVVLERTDSHEEPV